MKESDFKNIKIIVFISAIVLILIGIVEISVGLFLNSIGLIADGVDSIGNSAISLIVWLGLKISRKAPDKKFHFGYYRTETLASLLVAMIMIALSVVIFYNAYLRLINPVELNYPVIGMMTLIGAGVTATVISIIKNKLAKKYNLLSLKADAKNSIKDFSGSFTILFGIYLSYIGFLWGDSLGTIVVGVFIFSYGIAIIKEASLILIDAFHNPELIKDVRMIVNKYSMVKLKNIRLRRSGPYIVGEIIIDVNKDMRVGNLLRIKKEIRKKIMEEIEGMKDLIVSAEP